MFRRRRRVSSGGLSSWGESLKVRKEAGERDEHSNTLSPCCSDNNSHDVSSDIKSFFVTFSLTIFCGRIPFLSQNETFVCSLPNTRHCGHEHGLYWLHSVPFSHCPDPALEIMTLPADWSINANKTQVVNSAPLKQNEVIKESSQFNLLSDSLFCSLTLTLWENDLFHLSDAN